MEVHNHIVNQLTCAMVLKRVPQIIKDMEVDIEGEANQVDIEMVRLISSIEVDLKKWSLQEHLQVAIEDMRLVSSVNFKIKKKRDVHQFSLYLK